MDRYDLDLDAWRQGDGVAYSPVPWAAAPLVAARLHVVRQLLPLWDAKLALLLRLECQSQRK